VSSFFSRYLRQNSQFMKELLLDGELVKNGILSRPRLEAFFSAEQFSDVGRAAEIALYHAGVEAWIQGWSSGIRPEAASGSDSHISYTTHCEAT
jgi:hypothetical protein